MSIALPPLPFPANGLEPWISRSTVDFHYRQHHAAYVARLNRMVGSSELADLSLDEVVHTAYGNGDTALFNNAAQAWNHAFYWNSLRPGGGGFPHGIIATLIDEDFGTYEAFSYQLRATAAEHFGSGWAWLVLDGPHLRITRTANADTPLVQEQVPLLAIDVWEHAYYLDYQHRRTNYVAGVIDHLLNWDFVNQNLKSDDLHSRVSAIRRHAEGNSDSSSWID